MFLLMLCFSYFVLNIDCRCHVSRLSTTCTSFDFQLFDSTNYPALTSATYLGLREKKYIKMNLNQTFHKLLETHRFLDG